MKNLIICLAILIFGFSCNAEEFYEEGDIQFKSIKGLNNCPINILNGQYRFGVIIPKIPKGSKVNFDIEIRERM